MKKLFKKLKDSKVIKALKPVVKTVAGFLPGGRPALDVLTSSASALWEDKNNDGKVQLNEIKWEYIAGIIAMAILMRFEVVTKADLLNAAEVILTLLGGS